MTTARPDDRQPLVDPPVDAAWRAASTEAPPASLDAAILAAARREVGASPQSLAAREAMAARRRWWPLAAAATVAAIAVGVLQLTPPEELGAPAAEKTVVSDMPAPAATAAPEKVPLPAPPPPPPKRETTAGGGSAALAPAEALRADARQRQAPPPTPPAATAPTPPPVVARTESAAQGAAVGQVAALPEPFPAGPRTLAAESARPSPPPPAVPPPDAASAGVRSAPLAKMAASPAPAANAGVADSASGEARVKDRTPLPVPEWIALIRRLRDEGKTAEAAKELAAFRAAHADHVKLLPPDLRDWFPREK